VPARLAVSDEVDTPTGDAGPPGVGGDGRIGAAGTTLDDAVALVIGVDGDATAVGDVDGLTVGIGLEVGPAEATGGAGVPTASTAGDDARTGGSGRAGKD
jgi:hypothetical protein